MRPIDQWQQYVVFREEGPIKCDYRRFNISGLQAGERAMRQALVRSYIIF